MFAGHYEVIVMAMCEPVCEKGPSPINHVFINQPKSSQNHQRILKIGGDIKVILSDFEVILR